MNIIHLCFRMVILVYWSKLLLNVDLENKNCELDVLLSV